MEKCLAIAATLAALVSACASGDAESAPPADSALIGATTTNGDPAVVVITVNAGNGGGECTGELISKTVVLTAAHCVLTENGRPLTRPTYKLYRGEDFASASDSDWITIDPSQVHAHPEFRGEEHDIAVLVLSQPVDVTPLPINRTALSSGYVGKTVRLVGYGATVEGSPRGDDGFGKKRTLTTKINRVQTSFAYVGKRGQTACGGDSGGPALLEIDGVETIIGVDSYSDASVDCSRGEYYQRIDTELEFLAPYLTASAAAPTDAGS